MKKKKKKVRAYKEKGTNREPERKMVKSSAPLRASTGLLELAQVCSAL